MLGGAIGVVAVLSLLGWAWYRHSNRLVVPTELDGVALGMTALDVRLAKGAAGGDLKPEPAKDGDLSMAWFYENNDTTLIVIFAGKTEETLKVSIVCESGGYNRVLGLGRFSSEADVIAALGEPTDVSINKEGLSKMVSFKQWKAAFEIAKGQVNDVCVTESGSVSYREEYQEQTSTPAISD